MQLYLLLQLDAGMRSGTAVRITATDWKPEAKQLTFTTKGNRKMSVPATERLAKLLSTAAAIAAPGQPLVAALASPSENKATWQHRWARLKRKATIREELRPHDLRRTAATRLYNHTKDLRLVQQLLGHRSLSNTIRYLAPHDPGALKALLEQVKPQLRRTP